ncbi:MAG: hypothetical protein C7B45_06075 [Sulfobacillus acidophilus]|uniref:Uncharacterized protein n=1 Tax=Sulfobacillus acidophilus TaxID=53633 RepID=A0A2T2WK65_9FIRM|nr:MAG: hypothetical protein C7B45_06075 [Sulfobacillus acidophilus]
MSIIRVIVPIVALAATFAPWVTVGVVIKTRQWDAYQVGPYTWLWLVADLAAILVAALSLRKRIPSWMTVAWRILGAVSLGVGVSGVVFVGVSAHVSTLLSAPNPLRLAYGVFVFAIATALWTAMAWSPWLPILAASQSKQPAEHRQPAP